MQTWLEWYKLNHYTSPLVHTYFYTIVCNWTFYNFVPKDLQPSVLSCGHEKKSFACDTVAPWWFVVLSVLLLVLFPKSHYNTSNEHSVVWLPLTLMTWQWPHIISEMLPGFLSDFSTELHVIVHNRKTEFEPIKLPHIFVLNWIDSESLF